MSRHEHSFAYVHDVPLPVCPCGRQPRVWVTPEGVLFLLGRRVARLPGEREVRTFKPPRNAWMTSRLASPFSLAGVGRHGFPYMHSLTGERISHTHKNHARRRGCRACVTYLSEHGLKDFL